VGQIILVQFEQGGKAIALAMVLLIVWRVIREHTSFSGTIDGLTFRIVNPFLGVFEKDLPFWQQLFAFMPILRGWGERNLLRLSQQPRSHIMEWLLSTIVIILIVEHSIDGILPAGKFIWELLFAFLTFLYAPQKKEKLIISWPGYDSEEFRWPHAKYGIELRILQCQQDHLMDLYEALSKADGHQVAAIIADYEQMSRLQKDSRTFVPAEVPSHSNKISIVNEISVLMKSLRMIEDSDLAAFHKQPLRYWPIRYGVNSICWDCTFFRDCESFAAQVRDTRNDCWDFLTDYMRRHRRTVGFYDWWFLQMLIAAKLATGRNRSPQTFDELVTNLAFDDKGQVYSKDAAATAVWNDSMKPFLELLRNCQPFSDLAKMREDLHDPADGRARVLLGPGDSFVGPKEPQEVDWAFLGKAGGLVWVEACGFLQGDSDVACTNDEMVRFISELYGLGCQRAVCEDKALQFYANSPLVAESLLVRPKFQGVLQEAVAQRAVGQAAIVGGTLDFLSQLIEAGFLSLRPSWKDLRSRHWNLAYRALMH
jgi:hypothetical protein